MKGSSCEGGRAFRVWLVECTGNRPDRWHAQPRSARVVELAERGCLSAERARAFLETFNRTALEQGSRYWAVAVPVRVRYVGDLRPGGRYEPDGD